MKKIMLFLMAFAIMFNFVGQPVVATTYIKPYDYLFSPFPDYINLVNNYKAKGGTTWGWLTNQTVIDERSGGGGSTRGGGTGCNGSSIQCYREPIPPYIKTALNTSPEYKCANGICVDTSRAVITYIDHSSNYTSVGRPEIIDPVTKEVYLPYGLATAVDREGGGGVTRGGGAGRYPISDLEYDPTANIYVAKTADRNYFVEFTPLYSEITYDMGGNTFTDRYYYNLPDGRNTWNLKLNDVHGVPMLYDYAIYDKVAEDDGTKFLFHFNGDLKDQSYYNQVPTYANPTYNFVSSGNFNQAIKWYGNESLRMPNPVQEMDYTNEFRVYIPPVQQWVVYQSKTSGYLKDLANENLITCGSFMARPIFGGDQFTIFSRAYINMDCQQPSKGGLVQANANKAYIVLGTQDSSDLQYPLEFPTDQWVSVAIQRKGDIVELYINGEKKLTAPFFNAVQQTFGYDSTKYNAPPVPYMLIDEARLTNRVLFNSIYVPSSNEFTTNKVYVLPDSVKNGTVTLRTDIPVSTVRFDGAKPTYPQTGATYFKLVNNIIDSVQQYDGSDWLPVIGAIYNNDKWEELIGFNTKKFANDKTDYLSSDGERYCKYVNLLELENGVKNELDGTTLIKRVNTYTIKTSDISYRITWTNLIVYQIYIPDGIFKNNSSTYNLNWGNKTFFGASDLISFINNHYSSDGEKYIRVLFPKNKTLEDVQNELAGKTIVYQLQNVQEINDYCKLGDPPIPVDPTDPVDPTTGIVAAIIEALGKVLSSLLDLTGDVFTGLSNVLVALFVPSDTALNNMFDNLDIDFKGKFGFMTFPFDLFSNVSNRFITGNHPDMQVMRFSETSTMSDIGMMSMRSLNNTNVGEPIISIPQLVEPITGIVLIEPVDINFNEFVSAEPFNTVYDIYLSVVDVICILFLAGLAKSKYDSITRG